MKKLLSIICGKNLLWSRHSKGKALLGATLFVISLLFALGLLASSYVDKAFAELMLIIPFLLTVLSSVIFLKRMCG